MNGADLYYEMRGKGKPMYVVHGPPGFDHRYFGQSLAKLEGIRELFYIDLRGHGKSSKADPKTLTIDTFTDDIDALRMKLGHGSIEILGHAAGGLVGLNYALRYGDNLDNLILVGTAPKQAGIKRIYSMMVRMAHLKLNYQMNCWLHKTFDREAFARDTLLNSWPIFVPLRLLPDYFDYVRSLSDFEIFYQMRKELEKYDFTGSLENIRQPTLVIFGENDIHLNSGRALKTIRNSRFSVIPEARHMPFLEDEKYFNLVVGEFLTGKML